MTFWTRPLKQLIRRVLVTVVGVGFEFGVLDYMYIARVSEDPWGLWVREHVVALHISCLAADRISTSDVLR